jgi:hypothetical protein
LVFITHGEQYGQRLPACRFDLGCGTVNGARQLAVLFGGLGRQYDPCSITGCAKGNGFSDTPTCAGDEKGLVLQVAHSVRLAAMGHVELYGARWQMSCLDWLSKCGNQLQVWVVVLSHKAPDGPPPASTHKTWVSGVCTL